MKEIVPPPPPIVCNQFEVVRALFNQNVVPSYGRFDLVLSHGSASYVFDVAGKRYLDLGSGIAVCCLGHAHPAITEALVEQSHKLIHVSNLYYTEPQGRLAAALAQLIGSGKVFFANSGAEANEGLFKLARRFGHDEGRFEILTARNSFHGRTLAGVAATGQDKVKKGFEPMMPGFRHIPFNDLAAARGAISPATIAIMVEGVQGEGGVTPATPGYLLGLRALCDEKRLLLLIDGVQCGHFRTGRFQSFQRILEKAGPASCLPGEPVGASVEMSSHSPSARAGERPAQSSFLPDGLSMAKSLGGGFPIGAFWVRAPFADLLGPGTHASTFGGTPLACAVAFKVPEVIERAKLADNARALGDFFISELTRLARKHPGTIADLRGLGLMIGLELMPNLANLPGDPGKSQAIRFVNLLHAAGLLAIPAGANVIRLLPPLNLRRSEAQAGLQILESVIAKTAA